MDTNVEPREMTVAECRKALLDHLQVMADFWDRQPVSRKEAIEGIVFSFLTAIDGGTELPAMILAPIPHPEDKPYAQENGENWWPEDLSDLSDGELHSRWASKRWSAARDPGP
jgi:hypothetical protein